jgi:hypothetical protein
LNKHAHGEIGESHMEDKSQNLKVTQFTYKLEEMKKQEFEIFFGHFQHII